MKVKPVTKPLPLVPCNWFAVQNVETGDVVALFAYPDGARDYARDYGENFDKGAVVVEVELTP